MFLRNMQQNYLQMSIWQGENKMQRDETGGEEAAGKESQFSAENEQA